MSMCVDAQEVRIIAYYQHKTIALSHDKVTQQYRCLCAPSYAYLSALLTLRIDPSCTARSASTSAPLTQLSFMPFYRDLILVHIDDKKVSL